MATFEQIRGDFNTYVRNWMTRSDEIPYEIKTSIIAEIIRTGSIDSTRFIRAIDFREEVLSENGFRYFIDAARDSDVTYDGFLEFGTERLNAFGVLISPRYNYQSGIRNARLERIFDDFADDSFAR